MMNVPNQFQNQQFPLQNGQSAFKTTTIILGMIAVGLTYTDLFYLPSPAVQNRLNEYRDRYDSNPYDPNRYDQNPYDRNRDQWQWEQWESKRERERERAREWERERERWNNRQSESLKPCSNVEVERFFVSITVIALILSVGSFLIDSFKVDSALHKLAGPMLLLTGLMLLGYGVNDDVGRRGNHCSCSSLKWQCKNTYKIVAGLATFVNGVIFCILGFKKSPAPVQNQMYQYPLPARPQNMPYPGTTPSQQNVQGLVPLQPQPYQNMGQYQPGPPVHVQYI